jgi:hypothetical protein
MSQKKAAGEDGCYYLGIVAIGWYVMNATSTAVIFFQSNESS